MTPSASGALVRAGRRQALRGAIASVLVLGAGALVGRARATVPDLPLEVAAALPGIKLGGEGRFRYFGVHVYDARLWRPGGATGIDLSAQPFALELIYGRELSGQAIAERSLAEMRRLGAISTEQAQRWLLAMRAAFPDVRSGDRLVGLHRPGEATRFFHNGRSTQEVSDTAFAPLFFGIWLSPRSAAPGLRRALLGLAEGG